MSDVAAVLETEPEVVGHHREVAGRGDERDVGSCLERTTSIRLDDDPRLAAEAGDLAEVAPDLLRAAGDRADDLARPCPA